MKGPFRDNCLRYYYLWLAFLMVEGIHRALVLGLVLIAGTAIEQAPSVGPPEDVIHGVGNRLKDSTMMLGSSSYQASFTYWVTVRRSGSAFGVGLGVVLHPLSPLGFEERFNETVDANVQWFQYRSHTARNYDNLCLVLLLNMFDELGVSVAHESVNNKDTVVFFQQPPSRFPHTTFDQSLIHPPLHLSKVISWPVVCMETEDVPFFSMVMSDGRSKVSGVWSALPMRDSGGFSSLRRRMIKRWKTVTLCSRLSGSLWYGSCVVWVDHVVP